MDASRSHAAAYSLQSVICQDCGRQTSGRYCGACGQNLRVPRLNAEEFSAHFIETVFHLTGRYAKTYRRVLFAPASVVHRYIAGARQSIQGPISYFVFGYIAFSLAAQLAQRAHLETGTFGTVGQRLVLLVTLGPATISWLIAMRQRFTFVEALVCFFYLYGTVYPSLIVFMLLQTVLPAASLGLSEGWSFLYMDLPLMVISGAIAFPFAHQSGISVSRFLVAFVAACSYLMLVRHFFIEPLPVGL